MKAEGIKAGFPDLFLFLPRGKYAGLALEVKSLGKKLNPKQKDWLLRLKKQGYAAEYFDTVENGQEILTAYMAGTLGQESKAK